VYSLGFFKLILGEGISASYASLLARRCITVNVAVDESIDDRLDATSQTLEQQGNDQHSN
jgi:hypothetical protein